MNDDDKERSNTFPKKITIQRSSFFKKNQMVKIKKIDKVYGGPPLKLVYHRHLGLNLTPRDLFDQRRQT